MSRFGDNWDYDEPYPNAGAMWQANAERALSGRRGRNALAELREALLALPQKRLIAGALSTVGALDRPDVRDGNRWHRDDVGERVHRDGEGVCAIGAYLWFKKVKAGTDPQTAFEELPLLLGNESDEGYRTADEGRRAGLTFTLAWAIAQKNDDTFYNLTPEQRYEAFMEWLDKQLAPSLESQVS